MRLHINMDGIKPVKSQSPSDQTVNEPAMVVGNLDGVRYNLPQTLEVSIPKETAAAPNSTNSIMNTVEKPALTSQLPIMRPAIESPRLKTDLAKTFSKVKNDLLSVKATSHIREFVLFILLPVLALVVLISSFSVYSQTNDKYQKAVEGCKRDLNIANNLGLNTQDLMCPEIKLQISDYFKTFEYSETAKNASVINARKSTFEGQIQDLNRQLVDIQNQLVLLEVDYKNQIETAESSNRLDIQLDNKKIELTSAQKLLSTSVSKIDDLVNSYAGLITLLYPQDQKPAQEFLDNYKKTTDLEKIQKFGELKIQISDAQKKISENPPLKTSTEFEVDIKELVQYRIFSGLDFQLIYESTEYSKVTSPSKNLTLLGDKQVDDYIFKIAEKRGYKKRVQADEGSLVSYNGQKLQVEMQESLQLMQQEAAKSGVRLGLVSGYRSVVDQQAIFKSRFEEASKKANGSIYSNQEILAGKADKVIDTVLQTTSTPGYSRHHTGYTIDLTDLTSNTFFKDTSAYRWVSANNFLNAKKFGIIPSYPAGQTQVGPNPEEWEFVWVGVEKLKI
jgi:LAS superfamily LD-carboxypeptidase LdcB